MLTINLIVIGKLKESYLKNGCAEYVKRLSTMAKITIFELDEYKLPDNPSEAQIATCLQNEGKTILSKFPKGSATIPLCIEGKLLSSTALAAHIAQTTVSGTSCINFVIGGSYGLSDEVKQQSALRLSMSPMTFPHQLARLMLLEQIYRALSINNHSKYHK